MSSSNRRERALARGKYERQQQRRAQSAARRKARQRITGIAVVVVLVAGAVAWVAFSRGSQPQETAQPAASASPAAASPAPSSVPSSSAVPAATPSSAAGGSTTPATVVSCSPPGTPRPDNLTYASAPDSATAAASITLQTNCGDIVIETLPGQAPLTVASEALLAQEGFYDQTSCHRLTTAGIYVLQCGDPKGNGTGGPGYTVPDENLPAEGEGNYPAGTVAMANAGPGTSGSQFFIVYQDTTLPAGYSIWGKVVQGLDVVQGVAAAGVQGGGSDGPPAQPVFITKAIVTS